MAIPERLSARMNAGVTTLAWCWKITRRDGHVLAVTDHDAVIAFSGVEFTPDEGFSPSPLRSEAGLAPARGAAFGVVDSARIRESDIDNGLWDRARIELFRVDWRAPEDRFAVFAGEFGEIARSSLGFEVELNGLSARLNRTIGRVYAKSCDAELGDRRCGVDLDAPTYSAQGEVATVLDGVRLEATGLAGYDAGWFAAGPLTWRTGENAGAKVRVERHERLDAAVWLSLSETPARAIAPGDRFLVAAGCDKRLETCANKFSNSVNFRGCPFMPGNDVLLRHAGSAR